MMEIHTNDLVELLHNTLGNVYLKGARKQRIDISINIILEDVLRDMRKIASTLNDFLRSITNLA